MCNSIRRMRHIAIAARWKPLSAAHNPATAFILGRFFSDKEGSALMDRDLDSPTREVPPGTTALAIFALMPTGEALDAAIKQLGAAGFDRADLSLPEIDVPAERATPEAGAKPADTDVDAQQARLVHSGTGGAAAALIAGTAAAAATGGAAAVGAGAAIASGLAVGAAAHAISRAASDHEQADRDEKIATGKLVLSVRTPTRERQDRALQILREAGAVRIW
jgi:hypothetical protein